MSDKLTQNLTEATVVDTTNDRVPIYSAASPSELRYMTPNNLVPDSSATVKGKVELATTAETETGTDATRAVTPDSYRDAFATTEAAIVHAATEKTTPADADELGLIDSAASYVLKKLTWANLKATLLTWLRLSTTIIPTNAPQGFLINGKIVPSVSSNNLTVALKTLAGADPSESDPVYVRIGDTVRSITEELSITKNSGTNWFNAGSAELATKEIDYFVYIGYDVLNTTVRISFSRIIGNYVTSFSGVTNSEKYITDGETYSGSDYVELVGRFAATLSAGAGYTWSVPTYTASNLIQRPIYETRWLTFAPVFAGWSANPTVDWANYRIQNSTLNVSVGTSSGTSNATTATFTIPFAVLNYPSGTGLGTNAGTILTTPIKFGGTPASATITLYKDCSNAAWTNSGTKNFLFENIIFKI